MSVFPLRSLFLDVMMDVMLDVLWMMCCVISFWNVVFIQDEVLYDDNLLLWFNKSQPVGSNRVSPACSVLSYTICIVLSVMIFLYNDHNNMGVVKIWRYTTLN